MKLSTTLTKILPTLALVIGTSSMVHADDMMDARQADDTTVTKRQVNYQCQSGKSVKVTYGFNQQNLPTYAQATLSGKSRFMPINLAYSDNVTTRFGDDNNFSLGTSALTLSNYHKVGIDTIQNPASEILYKSCKVKSVKKLGK